MSGKHQLVRSRRSLPVVIGAVIALALSGTTVLAASAISAPTRAAAAGSALACDENTIYGIDGGGNLDSINVTTGAATLVKSVSPAFNGLGVASNGVTTYQYDGTDRKITKYDPITGTVTTFSNVDSAAPTTIIRGAIDPANGIFYYAGNGSSAYVGAWNTITDTAIGQVGTITGLQNLNGDFAFSSRGLLFVVSGNQILRVNDTTPPTTAGNEILTTTVIATLPAATNSPGIAFSSDGYLYISNGATLIKLDPASGAQVGPTLTLSGSYTPTDLASCNYPNTISVQKNVVGRVAAGDEFTLSVTGGGITTGNTATTTGSANGVQAEIAGASLVTPAKTYTVAETAAGGASLANYISTYSCVNVNNNAAIAAGSGASGAFVFPAAVSSAGTDVVCTFTNTPKTAPLTLSKALGGPRSDASDQFTMAIRSGSATGAVVNSTTNSTTTGTGATITPGTGTTGATAVVVANTYYLTESLAAGSKSVASQYTATITCTDPNGVQAGLPSGAAFNGSLAITPVVGSAISCTVTNTALPPNVSLTKNSPNFLVVGAVADYTLTVSNGGALPAAGHVLDQLPANIGFVSAQGNGWLCTASGTVAAGQLLDCVGPTVTAGGTSAFTISVRPTAAAAGTTVVNKASVNPTGGPNPPDPNTCTANNTPPGCAIAPGKLVETPSLMLTKIATPVAPAVAPLEAGEQIQWTFLVKNTSDVQVDNLTITDPTAGAVTCPVTTLAPGASTTCTAVNKYTVTAADVTAGSVNNIATATVTLPGCTGTIGGATCPTVPSNPSTTTTPTITSPTISLTKALGADRYNDADQFTVAIRTGSATGPVVSDPDDSTTSGTGSTVEAGSGTSGVFAATTGTPYFLTESASANGAEYTAAITCTDANGHQTGLPSGATFSGSISITPVKGAAIACTLTNTALPTELGLTKTGPDTLTVGAVTSYTLVVTNTGGQTGGTTITDLLPANIQFISASGTGWTCTASGDVTTGQTLACDGPPIPVTQSSTLTISVMPLTAAAGKTVVNKAAVDVGGGTRPFDPGDCTANKAPDPGCAVTPGQLVDMPSLDLVKKATLISPATSPVKAGDQIQYTFLVTNNSKVTVDNLQISDAKAGAITCPVTTLAPGANTTCSAAPYTVTEPDVSAGQVLNTATATGTLPGCTGTRGTDTCPVVTSVPSSTKTPAARPPTIAFTGVAAGDQILLGAIVLVLGIGLLFLGLGRAGRRRRTE